MCWCGQIESSSEKGVEERLDREKDMKKKVTVLTLFIMLFALCSPAESQQPTKFPRIDS